MTYTEKPFEERWKEMMQSNSRMHVTYEIKEDAVKFKNWQEEHDVQQT